MHAIATGSESFVFPIVTAPDYTGMERIFVPTVRLSEDGSGVVDQVEWQWWKNLSGRWSEATDDEVTLVLQRASVALESETGGWVDAPLALTGAGSVAMPAHQFAPTRLWVMAQDLANFNYSFVYRT